MELAVLAHLCTQDSVIMHLCIYFFNNLDDNRKLKLYKCEIYGIFKSSIFMTK